MINTILFDLDGTLAPFMQDDFIKAYFGSLVKLMMPMGYDKESIIKALWKGSMAMISNDGTYTNKDVFWKVFVEELGEDVLKTEDMMDEFYKNEFDAVSAILLSKPNRKPLIEMLREKGYGVVLATNPIFPGVAVETRLNWIGLTRDDFDYVTSYENSSYCKPNPKYYDTILKLIDKKSDECLMIGNHPMDDMSCLKSGIDAYLVVDCIENPDNLPIDCYKNGTFEELEKMLNDLPEIK